MKFNPLTLAILFATSTTLISCGDDDKKPEAKKETPAAVEQQKMSEAELAKLVETRYRNYAAVFDQFFAKINVAGRSPWQDAKTVVEDYQKQENGATAKELITITPNANFAFVNKPVVITIKDTIEYNPDLFKQGTIASIHHELDGSQIVENFHGSAEFKSFIEKLLKDTDIRTDLLPNEQIKSMAKISPFILPLGSEGEKEGSIEFKGIDASLTYHEKEFIEHLGAGKIVANIQPIIIKPDEDKGSINIGKIDFEQSLTPAGDFTTSISPLKFEIIDKNSGENITVDIDGASEKGTGASFDPILGGYLGNSSGKVGDISLSENGKKITFGNIDFSCQTSKTDQGHYDFGGTFTFNINGQSLQQRFEIPLLVNNFIGRTSIKNLSPEVFEIYAKMAQLEQVEDKATQEKAVLEALNSLIKNLNDNHTHIDSAFTLKTAQGDASIDLDMALRGSEINIDLNQIIEQALEDQMALLALLQENIDFKIDISVDRKLLEAFGMAELVELQGAGMIENKDGVLNIRIENSTEGLKVNGQPML